jgi:hypothetical protein
MKIINGDRYKTYTGIIYEYNNGRWVDMHNPDMWWSSNVTDYITSNYKYLGNFDKSRKFKEIYNILNEGEN